MYLLALSFIGSLALQFFSNALFQGFAYDKDGTTAVVSDVPPGEMWARAGVRAGDRITAIDHLPFSAWDVATGYIEPGRPFILQIERDGQRIDIPVVADRSLRNWAWPFWEAAALQVFTLFLGLLIAFRRPSDQLARLGAWCLGSTALALSAPQMGWAADWRRLPVPLGILLWPAWISQLMAPCIGLTFAAVFPRPLFRARWLWALIWTPTVVSTALLVFVYSQLVYRPQQPTTLAVYSDSTGISLIVVGYLIATIIAYVMNYRRLEDVNERRRVRILVCGTIVALCGMGTAVILLFLIPARVTHNLPSTPLISLLIALYFAFPVSFAYVILRHRVFDLGIILRRSLQYALARRLLLSAVPALAAVFLADLLLHGNQPILAVVRARGWMYAMIAALAAIALPRRQQWLESLDRRFFRERYDARRLLREVAEEVHTAKSLEYEAPRVVARIEAALHPEFAALMIREQHENFYHAVAAAPTGEGPPSLPKDTKLVALTRLLGKPLEVPQTQSGWLQQLPHQDTEFLRRARIDLIVPIAVDPQETEALIALGRKRSEEPYSSEDQDLLIAIAENLAILLERPTAPAAPRPDTFEECPQCGVCYDSGSTSCTTEGAHLIPVILPRLLGKRYRLEQRLGRGGMGTVYKARDMALDRTVAVKLIREELVANNDAAQRFHREAKIAASFSHPAVVTVYDFGVHGEHRAFLVMELLQGRTLRNELNRVKRMPPMRTLPLLTQVCAALEAAHRRQIVHRDIKPENLFLINSSSEELIKVLDFGLGKFLGADEARSTVTFDTGAGQLLGTMYYMCPEQLKSADVSPGWDLWALSVVAYELLAGAHPFSRSSIVECHRAIVGGNFTAIENVVVDASPCWNEFFTTSLSPQTAQRPQTATQWLTLFKQKVIAINRQTQNAS
jgi:eukaryotic-like serine/threonine-protein kinase